MGVLTHAYTTLALVELAIASQLAARLLRGRSIGESLGEELALIWAYTTVSSLKVT